VSLRSGQLVRRVCASMAIKLLFTTVDLAIAAILCWYLARELTVFDRCVSISKFVPSI
jgi:hypothetical protein